MFADDAAKLKVFGCRTKLPQPKINYHNQKPNYHNQKQPSAVQNGMNDTDNSKMHPQVYLLLLLIDISRILTIYFCMDQELHSL